MKRGRYEKRSHEEDRQGDRREEDMLIITSHHHHHLHHHHQIESGTDDSLQDNKRRVNRKTNIKKTREELNEKEKERTKRMNYQFDSLRALLQNSKIPTKKDKYSVLKNSYDYIMKLRHLLHYTEAEISRFCHSYYSYSSKNSDSSSISPSQFKEIFMNSSVAMAVIELNGKFSFGNYNFTRLSGYSGQDLKTKTIFEFMSIDEIPHLSEILQQFSSSQLDEPYQLFGTFQFSTTSPPISCSLTIWMIQQPQQQQQQQRTLTDLFQLMFLPLSDEIFTQLTPCTNNLQTTSSSSSSSFPSSSSSSSCSLPSSTSLSSSSSSTTTDPLLMNTKLSQLLSSSSSSSCSSSGISFVARHIYPLPPELSTLNDFNDPDEPLTAKDCQSPINLYETESIKSPIGHTRSYEPDDHMTPYRMESYISSPNPYYRSISNQYPYTSEYLPHSMSYTYHHSSVATSTSTGGGGREGGGGDGGEAGDQDDSDDTFENMPENWFDQDGEDDLGEEEDS